MADSRKYKLCEREDVSATGVTTLAGVLLIVLCPT